MKPEKFSCLSGSVASALALLLLSNVLPVSVARAQSASAVSLPSGTTAAPFLVAPSFALAGAPSSVAMGDLNEDGKPDLVTADALTGKVTVFLGTGNGKFASGVEYATGSHPGVVAVADLNGDGHPEVIVGDEAKGTISILASSGNGTLQLKQTLAAGLDPAFIAVGDFNGDGKTDLAVAARTAASLAILLNDGKGSLQAPTLSTLHKAPTSLISTDLNNDGRADLALANADGTVSILLGAGNGKFRSLADISAASGPLSSIAAGDFDRDGNIDLAVTQSGGRALTVLLGKGNGGFASPANYTVGNNPVSALVTDLDGDGVSDLVVINQGSNTYSVLGGNGDGTFKSSLDYVVGNGPVAAVAGEFDANGHVDLAVINPNSQSVTVPLGNGDGTFKAARSYLAGIEPRAVASIDLNGDKLPDLVVTNFCGSDLTCSKSGSVAVFLANADGSYRLANTYLVGAGPVSVALADVNGDKFPDIVAVNRGDKTVSVLLAKGDGGFEQPYTLAISESPIAVAVGDFNNDGKIDLAVLGDCGAATCSQPGSVEVLTGHGDGSFSSAFVYPAGHAPVSLAVGDLNQDKNLDIVVANRCGADASCKSPGTATVLLGGAAGKFTASTEVSLGNSPSSIALGDMSGRGVPDLLVSSSTSNTLGVLHGNGDGSFQTPVAYKIGNTPGSVVIADFNGDGKPDVAVANVLDSTVSVLFGKGDGTLNLSVTLPVGTGPAALALVAGASGTRASLVTANGNAASATPGTDFTVLANIQPESLGSGTTNVAIALGTGATSTSTVDQALALTATVTGVAPAGTPSGTVTFFTNGVAIDDCGTAGEATLVAGSAQCSTSSLIVGAPDSLTATYSGDTIYNLNDVSNTLSETVNKATATVTVGFQTGSSSPTTYGSPVTFVATIGAGGPVVPAGGTVSFTDSVPAPGTPITCSNTVTLTARTNGSTATCTIASLSVSASHTINATYTAGADPNFNTASSITGRALTVNQASPSVVVTLQAGSNNPSAFGAAVTFVATITGVSGLAVPTGGTVTFTDNVPTAGTALTCISPLVPGANNSTATCAVPSLAGGAHSITASYATGSDPNYGPATSRAFPQTVDTVTTTTVVTSSAPGGSNVEASVTFTATVTSSPTQTPAPTGTVSFTFNGNPLCTNVAKVGTSWTCTTQALTAPFSQIDATYNGDSNYAPSTAVKITQNVNKIAANTTLSAVTPTPEVNQAVTLTAVVKPAAVANPTVLPGGSVIFAQGATTLCTNLLAPVAGTATATCNLAFSAVQPTPGVAITATYTGDSNFTVGTAGSANQVVNPSGTKAAITSSSPSTSNVNVAVVFSSTVTPTFFGAPNGSVVPKSGTMSLFDAQSATPGTAICTATVTNGIVQTCSYMFPTSGPHSITAVFTSTDANFSSSPASAVFTQTVGSSGTTVGLTSSPTSSTVDQSVTFSATVTSSSSGTTVPQGVVVYSDTSTTPSTQLCSVTIGSTGTVPQCTLPLLTAANHTIVAAFASANGNFQSASSSPLTQIVNKGTPTFALSASPAASSVDQPVTFTLRITPPFTGTTVPTGKVTFSYAPNGNTTNLCNPVNVSTSGTPITASCTAPFPAAGNFTVTATYTGDGNFSAGTPATTSIVVSSTGTRVTVSSISPAAPSTISVNQQATFTATVASQVTDTGLTLPTGTVTFFDTTTSPSVALCTTGPAANGVFPACRGAFLTQGARKVTAVYNGDSNFGTSTSASVNQTAQPSPTTTTVASSSFNPSIVNQPVTFTTTLSPLFPGTAAPQSGTMNLYDAFTTPSTVICTVTVAAGVVPACPPHTFTVFGTHNITAIFTSTDSNFSTSNASQIFPQTVDASSTKVVMTATPASSIVNTLVTFNSTVISTTNGSAIPQGTVAYMDTSTTPATPLCSVTLASVTSVTPPPGAAPPCTSALATAATHTIEAVFTSTNGNFSSATSTVVNLTITPTAPTVAFSVVPTSPVTVDQTVNFTATLTQTPAGTANSTGVISYPTGTVTFSYILNNVNTIVCNTPGNVSTTGTVTSATCPYTFPTAAASTAPYTVTASYSGDKNFATGTQATTTQAVGMTGTSVTFNAPSPANAAVNQPVTFTASVAKAAGFPGSTLPTGNFTFYDGTPSAAATLCTATIVTPTTGIASCSAALHSKGAHTITATYDGDLNFSSSSATQTQTVIQTSPVIKLSGPITPVVATQVVSFTATVSPAVTGAGATAPTGTIVFSSSDGAPNSCNSTVTSPGDGTITNSCQFAFLGSTSGPVTVTASFVSADSNFASGTGTLPQTVENFSLAFSQPGPIAVTQGATNSTDKFTSAAVSVDSVPLSGYSDSLNLTCQVQGSASTPGTGTPPTCTLSPTTLHGSGASTSAFTITVPANAPVDQYTVTVTATDVQIPALAQSATLLVNVVNKSGTLSLSPGSAAVQSMVFNTAPPAGQTLAATLNTFACGTIVPVDINGTGTFTANEFACSGPSGTVPITGFSTTASVTIAVNATTTASLARPSGSVSAAAFWAVPLLALLAWVARRNSPRRNFFRFLGMLLLVVGLSNTIGCGGSFTRPPVVTGGPPTGTYLIQVVASDSNLVNHYAVVPLTVN
jgi:large repetitive protein